MMKKLSIKILTAVLSCLLLVGVTIGITVMAEQSDAEPVNITVKIDKKNISYDSSAQVLYTVAADNLPADATVRMLFDSEEIAADDVKNKNVNNLGLIVKYASGEREGQPVFFSYGVYAKNFRKALWAMPVVVDKYEKVIATGKCEQYNPYDYAMDRFGGTYNNDQFKLYTSFLHYGASVQEVLGYSDEEGEQNISKLGGWIDEYYVVTVDGKTTKMRAKDVISGDIDAVVTADRYKDGQSFNGWTDGAGNNVVGWTTLDLKPGYTTLNTNYVETRSETKSFDNVAEGNLPEGVTFDKYSNGKTTYLGVNSDGELMFGKTPEDPINDGSRALFASSNPGVYAGTYVYETDFCIDSFGEMKKNTWMFKFCLWAEGNSASGEMINIAPTRQSSTTYSIGNVTCELGTWHHLKMWVSVAEDGTTTASASVDGNTPTTPSKQTALNNGDYKMLMAGVQMRNSGLTYHDCYEVAARFDNVAVYAEGGGERRGVTLDATASDIGVQDFSARLGGEYSLPVPTAAGLTFKGWYDGDELVPQTGNFWQFVDNNTLTARWNDITTLEPGDKNYINGILNSGQDYQILSGNEITSFSTGDYATFTTTFKYLGGVAKGSGTAEDPFKVPTNSYTDPIAYIGFYTDGPSDRHKYMSIVYSASEGFVNAAGEKVAGADGILLEGITLAEGENVFPKAILIADAKMLYNEEYTVEFKLVMGTITGDESGTVDATRGTVTVTVTDKNGNSQTKEANLDTALTKRNHALKGFQIYWRTDATCGKGGMRSTWTNTKIEVFKSASVSKVTFDPVVGMLENNTPVNILYGQPLTLPKIDAEGYKFLGWYSGDTKFEDGKYGYRNRDLHLEARWSVEVKKDDYDDKTLTTSEFVEAFPYIIPSWESDVIDPVGTTYTVSMKYIYGGLSAFTLTEDAETGKITVTGNGSGKNFGFVRFYNNSKKDNIVDNPELVITSDLTVSGSFVDKQGNNVIGEDGYLIDNNLTSNDIYYSHVNWMGYAFKIGEVYDVVFTVTMNGVGVAPTYTVSVTYDGETKTNNFVAEGNGKLTTPSLHEFAIFTRNAGVTYKCTQTVTDVVFKRERIVERTEIYLDANGGSVEGDTSIPTYHRDNVTLPIPERDGYTFAGWYYDDRQVENGVLKYFVDISLVAKWTGNTYTVTLKSEDTTSGVSVTMGSAYDLGIPTKADYSFAGWYANSEKIETSGSSWNIAEDIELVAKFVRTHSTATLNLDGGVGVESYQFTYGEAYTLPTPTKEGYAFFGWYNDGGSRINMTGVWTGEADLTLTAKWGGKLTEIDRGNINATATNWNGYGLFDPNFSESNSYAPGTKYVIETTFTYKGATARADGSHPNSGSGNQTAFVHFLTATSGASDKRFCYAYITLSTKTINVNGVDYYESCSFAGMTFNYGESYNLRIEITVGSSSSNSKAKIDVVDDFGNVIKTGGTSWTFGGSGSIFKLGGLGLYFRGTNRIGASGFSFSMTDNVIRIEEPKAE